MEDEELYNITLRCIDCDNNHCKYGKLYILSDSVEGCTRIVDEDLFIEYQIQFLEKYPFIKFLKTQEEKEECYIETVNLLEKIYSCPIGHKISSNGKIVYQKFENLK